jgi:hypothetical protein
VAEPAGRAHWPWDAGTSGGAGTGAGLPAVAPADEEEPDVPGRSWLRLAIVIAVCLVLLLAIVVAYNLGRGRTPLGAVPSGDEGSARPRASSSASPPAPITGLTADDLDPQGSPPFDEHPELTPLAVDGKPDTAWQTMTYDQQLGPGGLKTGVGLVVDLGSTHDVREVDLTFGGQPTSYSLYVTDQQPTAVQALTPVARGTADGTTSRATLDSAASGRFVTVWLTALPAADGGYRGAIAEVEVLG